MSTMWHIVRLDSSRVATLVKVRSGTRVSSSNPTSQIELYTTYTTILRQIERCQYVTCWTSNHSSLVQTSSGACFVSRSNFTSFVHAVGLNNVHKWVLNRRPKGLFTPKAHLFFCCGNSAADISKPHTFKWNPLADDVLEAAWSWPTDKTLSVAVKFHAWLDPCPTAN